MKKLGLVSLAAAVALSTSAMAEDVKFSGKLYVEGHHVSESQTTGDDKTSQLMDLDFDITAMKKINDNWSATVTAQADSEQSDDVNTTNANLDIETAKITYAAAGATVSTGLMTIDTPTSDGEVGEGLFGTYTAGPVTLAAANFMNNAFTDAHVSALAVLGSAGPVSYQLWQVTLGGHSNHMTAIVGAKMDMFSVEGRMATSTYEDTATKDGSTMKIVAGMNVGVPVKLTVLTNDADGAALTTDASSSNNFELVGLNTQSEKDATLMNIGTAIPVGVGTLALDYATLDLGKKNTGGAAGKPNSNPEGSESELKVKFIKDFGDNVVGSLTYAAHSYSPKTGSSTDTTRMRYDIKYSF